MTIIGAFGSTTPRENERVMNEIATDDMIKSHIKEYKATLSEVLQYIDQQKSD